MILKSVFPAGEGAAAEAQHRAAGVRALRPGSVSGLRQRDPGPAQTLEEAHCEGEGAVHQDEAVHLRRAEHPGSEDHPGPTER